MSAGEAIARPAAKFFSTSGLRKLRGCEQVAAVCYRIGRSGIQFLLVQTRSGRWTFPKGGLEPSLTRAQTAALEAFEEAGVHGRIEQVAFARYVRRKSRPDAELVVHAYLCEVLQVGPPQESGRNPTWFSPAKAKQCLQRGRNTAFAMELACVVDRAVVRIQRLGATNGAPDDELQRVHFEAGHGAKMDRRFLEGSLAAFTQYDRGELPRSAALALAANAHISKLVGFAPFRTSRLLPAGEQQSDVSGPLTIAPARTSKGKVTAKPSKKRN